MKRIRTVLCAGAVLLASLCTPLSAAHAEAEKMTDPQEIYELLSAYIPELQAEIQDGWQPSVFYTFPPYVNVAEPGSWESSPVPGNPDVVWITVSWYADRYVMKSVSDYLQAHNADESKIGYHVRESGEKPVRGDTNCDASITSEDAQNILKCYTNRVAGFQPSLLQTVIADVDGDLTVSSRDAQYTLMYYTYNQVAGMQVSWAELIG